MSDRKTGFMADQLSKTTSIFGLRLWAVLGVCVGAAFVLFLFLISLWLASKRTKRKPCSKPRIPVVSKEIQEIKMEPPKPHRTQIQTDPDQSTGIERQALLLPLEEESPTGFRGIHIEIGKDHKISYPGLSPQTSGEARVAGPAPEVSHLGWGHWYTLRELEFSTNGFAHEKVIGEGGYGIVYHGSLEDNSQVAVKNLLNNRGQAEKEFKVEVEAIGRVRHKNLARLLGYCAEGAHRMLVYEYVNNGNLEQWLHGDVGSCSPLTWDIRMNIILGTAKGLAYLHEGLDPKVVHRDIKSSNILLDKSWNPKVSDFGLAKLLGSESSYIRTRVMGTFGYVAPEYASTGMLNERSDVYSFGILIMEIVTGRNPVDYSRPPEEVNLIEWLKKMVANRNPEGVLDPKLPEKPTSRPLKRALLVALRCVDPNAQKRPKMGHIIHMLETEESPSKDDSSRAGRDAGQVHCDSTKNESTEKRVADSNGNEVAVNADRAES
ncbi:putative receptor-like protein kinase [Hibiscus syriacus]|uniref:non-specific serine/threonine protein kinase n=1 Tax=Hibiscus syriacus TaxID=106335 RepID=A0A6A2XRV9_HIBSY|nr:probable serine/threonine-protein kinase At1g01540 [Hibiscus syriacus]KAE8672600.1 putative receptor-like protein kinase [Hibiscus syriacus]